MSGIAYVAFHSLPVTDQDRAMAFWRDVMGFSVTTNADYMPGARWIMLRPADDSQTQIHLERVDKMPERTAPAIPLVAPDVAAVVANLKEHSAHIVQEPQPAPWNPSTTYAMFNDSEGNLILLQSQAQ